MNGQERFIRALRCEQIDRMPSFWMSITPKSRYEREWNEFINQDDNPESPNKGQTIRLSDFQGKKILLDFWSTRCSACLAQFPHIRAVYDNHGRNSGDIAVITVCIDGDRTDRIKILSDKYTDKFGAFNFPILLDKEHVVTDMYNIWRIPKTIFIDSDGIIREIRIGRFDTQQEIEDVIESL